MNFPIVIKYSGLDELQYVEDKSELLAFQTSINTDKDVLIDSKGRCFELNDKADHVETGKLSLNQFESLIQKHALITGLCCTAKIRITSFVQGIEIVKEA